jgi:hypothetical protein
MITAVWWSNDGGMHWRFMNESGELVKAKWIRFGSGTTDLRSEGFLELPGGPRGVIRADVVTWEAHDPNNA